MATLPDIAGQSQQPVPQPAAGVASYEPPNWRQVGMAGQIVSGAARDMGEASSLLAAASDHQDQIVAMSAANAYKAQQAQLEQDPNSGFLNAKGNQVIGQQFTDGYMQKAKDAQSQIADTLTNTNQRQIFAQHAEVMGLQFQSALMQHQAKETAAFNTTSRNDTVQLGLNDIAAHPYDDVTYQTNQLLMGKTVVDAGKDMGLTGDALANWVRVGTSKLESQGLFYRTNGMLMDDPMKAADFFHQHELEFDPQDRMHLRASLKTSVDAQTSRVLGAQAYQASIGTPAAPDVPANLNADFVKPYDQDRIGKVITQVKAPSAYDSVINAAAQANNISPTELKMRLVVESGLDPNAASHDRGGNVLASGIAQFSPATAKAYGIDPMDPKQAIYAAAKYMASAGGTAGGDMSKVDRAYYGGSANAGGPNTNQYVENLRAVRQQLMGAPAPVLTQDYLEGAEGRVMDNAAAFAEQHRPGDMVYKDQVQAEARKNWANNLAAIRGTNQQTVSNIMGLLGSDKPPQTVGDLPPALQKSYSDLPGNVQAELRTRMSRGDKAPTQESTNLYYQLLGQATNPATQADFADPVKTNLSARFPDMPYPQLHDLIQRQASINMKDATQQAKDLNWKQALGDVQSMWKPVIEGKSKVVADKLTDQFNGRFSEALNTVHQQTGKWPTTIETQKIAGSLLTAGTVAGTGWINEDSTMAFQTDPAKFHVPLPPARSAEYAGLTTSFQKVMGRAPGYGELQQWYTKYKLAGGK